MVLKDNELIVVSSFIQHLKNPAYCKAVILQFKKINLKKANDFWGQEKNNPSFLPFMPWNSTTHSSYSLLPSINLLGDGQFTHSLQTFHLPAL